MYFGKYRKCPRHWKFAKPSEIMQSSSDGQLCDTLHKRDSVTIILCEFESLVGQLIVFLFCLTSRRRS